MTYTYNRQAAAQLPTLSEVKFAWIYQVAEAMGQYFEGAGGGWRDFDPKAKVTKAQGRANLELKCKGWTGFVAISSDPRGTKIIASLTFDKDVDEEDLLKVLTSGPNFERGYKDTDEPKTMISDVSLFFSKATHGLNPPR